MLDDPDTRASQGTCAIPAGRPVMRPSRSSGTAGMRRPLRPHPPARQLISAVPRNARCRNGAPRRTRRARAGDPSADASEKPANGLTRIGQVVREQAFRRHVNPGVDEQHARPACTTTAVALAELALVDSTPSATCLSTELARSVSRGTLSSNSRSAHELLYQVVIAFLQLL